MLARAFLLVFAAFLGVFFAFTAFPAVSVPALKAAPIVVDDGVVLHPKSFRKDDVGIADIVELHIIHFGNLCHLGILLCKILHHLWMMGVESLIVGNVSTVGLAISTLSQTIDSVPRGVHITVEHGGHPRVVFQAFIVSNARSSLYAVSLETSAFYADSHQTVALPEFEQLLQTVGRDLFGIPFIPAIDCHVGSRCLLAAVASSKSSCQQTGGGSRKYSFHR